MPRFSMRGAIAAALLSTLVLPLACEAAVAYLKWTTVTLPVGEGASCGNGTPARVLVNLTPHTTKTVVYFEGGGACWAQNACLGQGKFDEVASNPGGVPENYFSRLNMAVYGQATPLITRTPILGKVFTQDWNMVYVPYCTGDAHAGNKVMVYGDADPAKPLTYYHRGHVNAKALARWMAANMPRPAHLLVTGSSAGGLGATANYGMLRDALKPVKSALASDSGPLFPAPKGGSPSQYPSILEHAKARENWGFDGPQGAVTELLGRFPQLGDLDDLSNLNTGLARAFPQDRFGFMAFQDDGVFPVFAYKGFYPEIAALSGRQQADALNVLWRKDVANWIRQLGSAPNIGYYVPTFRPFLKSHTLLIMDFSGTAIEDQRHTSVKAFLENLVDDSRPLIRAVEVDQVTDHFRLGISPLQWLEALFEALYF